MDKLLEVAFLAVWVYHEHKAHQSRKGQQTGIWNITERAQAK